MKACLLFSLVAFSLSGQAWSQSDLIEYTYGFEGFYTDAASYKANETMRVYGNWGEPGDTPSDPVTPRKVKYILRSIAGHALPDNVNTWPGGFSHLDSAGTDLEALWPTVAESASTPSEVPEFAEYQTPPFGSFVKGFNDFGMSNGALPTEVDTWDEFTMLCWFRPTLLPGSTESPAKDSILMGQGVTGVEMRDADGTFLGLNKHGRVYLAAEVNGHQFVVEAKNVVHPDPNVPLDEGLWYLAAGFLKDGELSVAVIGYLNSDSDPSNNTPQMVSYYPLGTALTYYGFHDTGLAAPAVLSSSEHPFRVGASASAPGNNTGCFSGRIDEVFVWSRGLSLIEAFQAGTNQYHGGQQPDYMHEDDLQLYLDFELELDGTPYDSNGQLVIPDKSPHARHGTVRNHGVPALSGIRLVGGSGTDYDGPYDHRQSLGLFHDQVIDAEFDEHVIEFDLSQLGEVNPNCPSPMLRSGFYILQAVFETTEGQSEPFDATTDVNLRPNHLLTFAVTPALCQTKEAVAFLIPTNTWVAYNNWPSGNGSLLTVNPEYLIPRTNQAGRERAQGGNSVYESNGGQMGNYYGGWRRPNIRTSPLRAPVELSRNEHHGPLAATMVAWLNETGVIDPSNVHFDVYTDFDLDSDLAQVPNPLSSYSTVIMSGQPEYVSDGMLNLLHDYMDSHCGNLISVAGNSIAWRAELAEFGAGDAGRPNQVVEFRKWPEAQGMLIGLPDAQTFFGKDPLFQRMGAWRMIEQTRDDNPSAPGLPAVRDYILGTIPDSGGILEDACSDSWEELPDNYGYWQSANSNHPWTDLWGTDEIFVRVGRVVGNESDRVVKHEELIVDPNTNSGFEESEARLAGFFLAELLPGVETPLDLAADAGLSTTNVLYGLENADSQDDLVFNPPSTLPPYFPYGNNGQLVVLGQGQGFSPCCSYNTIMWCSPISDTTEERDFDEIVDIGANLFYNMTPVGSGVCSPPNPAAIRANHGNIIYYRHRGGGRVLTISSIYSPMGLVSSSGDTLRNLVGAALQCGILGVGCPDDQSITDGLWPKDPPPTNPYPAPTANCNR